MFIIDTIKKQGQGDSHKKRDSHLADCHLAKNRSVPMFFAPVVFAVLLLTFLGCAQSGDLGQAQEAAKQSASFYEKALSNYKSVIAQGKDLDKLHFELGRLYYQHGDFKQAQEEFKKSADKNALQYLAIAYYRLSDFTDAFEAFVKLPQVSDEGRFYWGLTAEKLNLFDQALDIYRKIKAKEFVLLATERINLIEKQANLLSIKDISPQAHELIAQSPAEIEYPQAGALILLSDENIEVTSLNTQVSEMRYLVKILNERGKEEFSEAHIDYDTTYEKVELVYARTIKPDGTVVDVGSRHIRDVSKYLNFPLYSNAHVYIISFPEITSGAVIDYKVKIYRNELVNKKDFVIPYSVQALEPVLSARFSLVVPKGKPVNIKVLNEKYNDFGADLKPVINEDEKSVKYSWQFKGVPQIMPEANMPAQVEINPAIILSSFESWDEIYKWWWGLSRGQIKSDSAIKAKVQELTKAKLTDEEKISSIYNFCAKGIRYVGVEYGQAGYKPHKAEDIFKNKYGDCKDQAVLLVAMLAEAGFKASLVLIPTKDCYNLDEKFPSMFFNHAIAAIPIRGEFIFMDPTAETCSFRDLPAGDQGRRVLIFKEDGYQIQNTPLYPAAHNQVRQELKIKINPQEDINAERRVNTNGAYDQAQRYWLLYTPPELIGETLKEKIQAISIGGKLQNYLVQNLNDLNKQVVLEYTFSGPEYLTLAGPLRIVPQLTSLDTALVAKDKRKYPLDFEILDSKETNFEIAIPDGFVVKYMPQDIVQDSPWMKFSARYKFNGNKIYFEQDTELKENIISEADYRDFKSFYEGLAKQIKQRVILEQKK